MSRQILRAPHLYEKGSKYQNEMEMRRQRGSQGTSTSLISYLLSIKHCFVVSGATTSRHYF